VLIQTALKSFAFCLQASDVNPSATETPMNEERGRKHRGKIIRSEVFIG